MVRQFTPSLPRGCPIILSNLGIDRAVAMAEKIESMEVRSPLHGIENLAPEEVLGGEIAKGRFGSVAAILAQSRDTSANGH